MINVDDKEKCCACGACEQVCPVHAITMSSDGNGNYYPSVYSEICIDCGKCEKVCTYHNKIEYNYNQKTYAVVLKNKDNLKNSASGGAAYGLARCFLKNFPGSVVCGCAYDEECNPTHIIIGNYEDVYKLQGSKYCRSDVRIYQKVLANVKNQKNVLFFGTPCQCNAIKLFCKGHEEYLYTVDLICHGVIDIDYWKDYVSLIQKEYKGKLLFYSFRDKDIHKPFKSKFGISRINKNNRKVIKYYYESSSVSYYYSHFLSGSIFRENCYECPFARRERSTDITIGDYWGYEGKLSSCLGISAVLTNSDKGNRLFLLSSDLFDIEERSLEDVAKYNEQLNRPFSKEKKKYKLLSEWKEKGSIAVQKEHHKKHWKAYLLSQFGLMK